MEIVKRIGSIVTIRDKKGKLWLTRRKKRNKDSRRRVLRNHSVVHIPIKRIPEKGDWLFTCRMEPVQFGEWNPKSHPDQYTQFKAQATPEEFDEFINYDDFVTLDGSHHSRRSCSLSLISDEYAKFFIDHKLWNLFDLHNKDFDKYEEAVRKVCELFKIKYEGI